MEGNDEIQLFGSWARATQLPMLGKLPARVRPVNIRAHSLEVAVEVEAAPFCPERFLTTARSGTMY